MRATTLAAILCVLPVCLIAQEATSSSPSPIKAGVPRFALRLERSRAALVSDKDCLLVLPDGHYRREQNFTHFNSFTRVNPMEKHSYVYEGTLDVDEINELSAIVNAGEFRRLKEPDRLPESGEFLEGLVFRELEQIQKFRLGSSGDYKKNKVALNPLFDFWRKIEKRDRDLQREAEPTECRLPARLPLKPPVRK